MTHFLCTPQAPEGHRLEDLLSQLRRDLVKRMGKICDDERPEARRVLENDIKILAYLSQSIDLAEDSSRLLLRSLGPPRPGQPRIGTL